MRFWSKAAAALAAAGVASGIALAAAPSAMATNQVACTDSNFYTITSADSSQQCFANAGDVATWQYNTYSIWTGNNTGQIYYIQNSTGNGYYSTWRYPGYYGTFDAPYVDTQHVYIN